jgi:hypothetical protein
VRSAIGTGPAARGGKPVARPGSVQRRVRDMAQCGPARIPGRGDWQRGGRATVRTLAHNGSECGLRGLGEMAVPPLSRGQVLAGAA